MAVLVGDIANKQGCDYKGVLQNGTCGWPLCSLLVKEITSVNFALWFVRGWRLIKSKK